MFHVAIYMYNTPPGPTDIAGWETTSQNGGRSTGFVSIDLMVGVFRIIESVTISCIP